MLENNDLQKIKEIVDESIDKKLDNRFKDFESKIDLKFDNKFKDFESKMDLKFDNKFKDFESKMDLKFEEQAYFIKQKFFAIHEDIKRIDEKLDRIIKTETEDVVAVSTEVEMLKERVHQLELQVNDFRAKAI